MLLPSGGNRSLLQPQHQTLPCLLRPVRLSDGPTYWQRQRIRQEGRALQDDRVPAEADPRYRRSVIKSKGVHFAYMPEVGSEHLA